MVSLLRVSTTTVEQSESPEAQHLYIQEQIRRNQTENEVWIDTGLIYQDELTGAVVMNRPDIKRLVEDASAHRFDIVLMKAIKRLGRDTLGLLTLKRFLDDQGIELIGLQDGYRSSRDLEIIFLIHADRAQAEREDLSKNVRNAMRQRAQQGRWTCGKVPFGYRRRTRHELEPHPDTAPIVREIFHLRRSGLGLDRITKYLNESKIPAPAWWEASSRLPKLAELQTSDDRFAKRYDACRRLVEARKGWHVKSIRFILGNTAYYGELQYNRRYWKTQSSQGGKKVLQTRDKSEVIVVPCLPLMTKAEWEASQKRRREIARWTAQYVYLLTSLIICGHCGAKMTGGGTRKAHKFYGYYYCAAVRAGLCSCKPIRCQRLESAIMDQVTQHISVAKHYESLPTANLDAVKIHIRQLESKLADLREERRYYRNEHRRERLPDKELDEELRRIDEEDQRAQLLLDAANQALNLPAALKPDMESLRHIASRLLDLLAAAPPAPAPGWTDVDRRALKSLLLQAVDRVIYRGEGDFDIHLQFSAPPPTTLPS